jgi:hypothetical protein
MPGRGIAKLAVSVAFLLSAVTSVLWISDAGAISSVGHEFVVPWIAPVSALLLVGVALSSLRLKLITADLGYPLSFRDAAMTLSVGQLAGTVFFQLAGQLIGRSAVLSRRGIPPAASVVISGYERVMALSVSLLLAAAGAIYLFGTISLNLETGGSSLLKLAICLVAVTVAGALLAWGRPILDLVRKMTAELFFRLLRSFAISLAIQATTLGAYVALETALAPHIGIASLAAASCIIMLAASLPISFGGWGLRELSAVVALQAIGLSSASALLIALLIGVLSLAVIAGTAIVIMVGWRPAARSGVVAASPATPDYTAALDWLLPLMAVTAVFFQIYIPSGNGQISVNLADPLVILGAGLFALHHIGKGWPAWRVPGTGIWIAAASAVILLSLVRGWVSFGWTDWAFINKGLGWLVLLCYGTTGALITRRAHERGLEFLLKTFVASGAAIAVIDIACAVPARMGMVLPPGFVDPRLSGLSQNPNAFAFMLVLVLAGVLALRMRFAAGAALMAVALVGVWFTGSRAGFVAVPVVFAAALMLGAAWRPMLAATLAAAAFIVGAAMLQWLLGLAGVVSLDPEQAGGIWAGSIVAVLGRTDAVTIQHLQTIQDGFAIFLAHPILGAGLGAYVDEQVRTTGLPLVIHSTAVWLLAETGPVGLAVFVAAAWRLFADAVRRRGDPAATLLILMFCAFAAMSAAHEMLYQRSLWLLLGAVLAMPASPQPDDAVRRSG